ncbi:MAG: UDP-N-acetylmuramoyl-L-alanine--D-glutamate ligase, partial [bacterium]|nr:UDP-N-acetylmuramoyl-L-alanine--D-glutamate ligase [bacterium]
MRAAAAPPSRGGSSGGRNRARGGLNLGLWTCSGAAAACGTGLLAAAAAGLADGASAAALSILGGVCAGAGGLGLR